MKRDVIYEGNVLTLAVLDDRWEIVEHAPAVAVLALRGSSILGVTQHRPAIGKTTWEVPAGLVDPGETPLQAAKRELAEETQLTGELSLVTQLYSSPGFTDEKIHLYHARNLSPTQGKLDEGEELSVVWRNVNELWDEVHSGKTASSSPSVLALSVAKGLI